MIFDQLGTSGALPTLTAALSFAGQRQRLIAHNIANISTPNFRPMDVSPSGFQHALAEAVENRREQTGGTHGALEFGRTNEVAMTPSGGIRLNPGTPTGNILFHDRNNRDVERMMQSMVENATAHRVAATFMRSEIAQLRSAIAERAT